ncbi:DUF2628 domain-containing protein [Streptomyces sp. NPDC002513]
MVTQAAVSPKLSAKKQARFAFFETYGGPLSPAYKEALRAKPFAQRLFFNTNWWAFFFGPIYFFSRGMWRKGTVVLLGLMAYFSAEVSAGVPKTYHWVGTWTSFVVMWCANYADYLKTTKGTESWNPFEGFRNGPK